MTDRILYWDLAHRLDVARESPREWGPEPIYKMAQLEGGIKFFILALEELGATTKYSCEGHPTNAYVSFNAPSRLAKEIELTGTFFCKVFQDNPTEDKCDCAMYAIPPGQRHESYTEEMRVKFLRESAAVWMREFGDRLPKLRKQLEDLAAQIPPEQQFHYFQQGVSNGNFAANGVGQAG
jgi:hypothetical protein